MALVVCHHHAGVVTRLVKYRVGAERSVGVDLLSLRIRYRRLNNQTLIVTEEAALARVGVQARHRYARCGNADAF